MRRPLLTVAISAVLFLVSLLGMKMVPQQFFPPSSRSELVVDFNLPQNASIAATKAAMDRFERQLAGHQEVESWSSYVGQGAIRFVLAFDIQMPNPSYGQIIIVSKDVAARDRLRTQLKEMARREFVGIDVQVELLPMGPPAGRPVISRVPGRSSRWGRFFSPRPRRSSTGTPASPGNASVATRRPAGPTGCRRVSWR